MKYRLLDTKINQFLFSPTGVQVKPNTQVKVLTQIGRRHAKMNEPFYEITLVAQIQNTEENPSPFNLAAEFSGLFEVTEIKDDADFRKFIIEGSKVLYPHLCALYSSVANVARLSNLHLPFKSGPIMPEDEDKFAFVIGGNENTEKPN